MPFRSTIEELGAKTFGYFIIDPGETQKFVKHEPL